ncbi:MAG: hypothetical protein ACO2ER_08180 [Castellaniella sp.]
MNQDNKKIRSIRISEFMEKKSVVELRQGSDDISIKIFYADLNVVTQSPLPEAIGIQRLLTLASECTSLSFEWDEVSTRLVFASPTLFPLLAVVLCLQDVAHSILLSTGPAINGLTAVEKARKTLLDQRLQIDAFADCQIAVCADSLGHGAHPDLYSRNGVLFKGNEMGGLMEDLMVNHLASEVEQSSTYKYREVLGVILSELFENTEIHAKKDLQGKPIVKNGIRGLIIKRIEQESRAKSATGKASSIVMPYLELSVFDSGVGFYSSFSDRILDSSVSLEGEWAIMHHCLSRHASHALTDRRPGYRGLGLYEVLRALMFAKGYFEVRTGRLRAYRGFFDGDLPVQIESKSSEARPGMPKPVLLDVDRLHFQVPTEQEKLIGSTVRVLIPLKG